MRRVHLWLGTAGLLLFLATGQYMAAIDVPSMADHHRLFYRFGHIYLLLAFGANIVAGYCMPRDASPRLPTRLLSLALLATPLVLTASFFIEPAMGQFERPLASAGLFLFFGMLSLMIVDECYTMLRR